jgi:hypothetical protein
MSKDWDKELAKIDKQLASISDEQLLESKTAAAAPRPVQGGQGAPPVARQKASPAAAAGVAPVGAGSARGALFGVGLRLALAAALGVGMVFWPYRAACGLDLAGYLGAVGAVILAGGWTAVWTWRHRSPRAHVASLLLVGWGLALAAAEILPRSGYARPDPARSVWVCE